MKQLFNFFRYLINNKGTNLVKIVSLTLGLVAALVLFSQVAFDMSYDNFYPDKERIYSITCKWNINGKEDNDEGRIINAPFAPTMSREIPEVESGTVMTGWVSDVEYLIDDERIVTGKQSIADSLFFQTFGHTVVAGNVADMGKPMHAFVSETFAVRAFGETTPIGKQLTAGDNKFTIAGVFKDIPKNSHLQTDVVVAFNTMYEWGARPGWQNNDAYLGYVKLVKGADPRMVEAKIPDMMRRHFDLDKEIEGGIVREYFIRPVVDIHTKDPEVKRTSLILSILAIALLFAAAMNYVLLSISGMPKRAKTIGVHKCNGASNGNIFSMLMTETVFLIIISLLLSVLIIFSFRGYIGTLIKSDISAIFTLSNLWVSGIVLLVLFFTTAVIPSRIYATIPVTQVFKSYSDSKKTWKKILLFVQFTGISFMISLLVIIIMQYNMILNKDMGYDTKQLLICSNIKGMAREQLETAKAEFLRLPNVEAVSLTTNTPLDGLNGMPVVNPVTKENLFVGRLMLADEDFIKTFNITLKEGRTFRNANFENSDEVIVNETFVKMIGFDDPIGKTFEYFSTTKTICGVMKNYQTGTAYNEIFPVVILPLKTINWFPGMAVRLNTPLTASLLSQLSGELKKISKNEENVFTSFKEKYDSNYLDTKLFRDAVIVASALMLLISLLGLFGFVEDELVRRTKEIAVRKVNGALAKNILSLMTKGIGYIALPAIISGLAVSFLVASEWMQQFAVKMPLSITLFLLCGIGIFLVIQLCVIARATSVAISNPVNYLKME